MPTFTRKQIALARSAGSIANPPIPFVAPRDGETANAFDALLAAFSGNATDAEACYTASAAADPVRKPRATSTSTDDDATAKRHAQNDAEAKAAHDKANAKPEKPSKPAAGSPNADTATDREALINELRASVAALYNGPSLAVRSNPKRVAASVYADLFAAPKHRTTLAKLSIRDESALFLCLKRGDKRGGFDPVNLNLDSGIFSRLASVGFIVRDGDGFALSADALAHARKAAKRAA